MRLLSNIPYVPLLVCGASLTGLGIAFMNKERALVVERTGQAGSEFIACFRPGDQWDQAFETPAAQQLAEELKRRNLLVGGRISVPAVAPVLFHKIRQEKLQVKMLTEILKIEKNDAGCYDVTLFHASGIHQVRAGAIIDTTAECISSPSYPVPIRAKYVNAMLHCKWKEHQQAASHPISFVNIEAANKPGHADVQVSEGRFPGERILHYELDVDDDWITARKKVHEAWAKLHEHVKPWTLALIAQTFDIRPAVSELQIDENWLWLPSAAYANLALAFDAGVKKGRMIRDTVSTGG